MSSQYQYPTPPEAAQTYAAPSQYYPAPVGGYQVQYNTKAPHTNNYLELGKFGATVAFCGAAAANLRRLQHQQIGTTEALLDSVRSGIAGGLATAAAGYVANQFRGSATSLAATLITGTAAMYLLNTDKQSKSEGNAS